jgi:hypothetical protein
MKNSLISLHFKIGNALVAGKVLSSFTTGGLSNSAQLYRVGFYNELVA